MTLAYVLAQLRAALAIARREPNPMQGFDLTIDGFWRSFWAAFICLPGFLLLSQAWDAEAAFSWPRELLAYVVGWAAFPLAMVPVSRMLDLADRYVALIVAANWAAVLQMVAFVIAVGLGRSLPAPVGPLVLLVGTVLVILYQYRVIRVSLGTTVGIAAGLTLLEFVLGVMIDGLFTG